MQCTQVVDVRWDLKKKIHFTLIRQKIEITYSLPVMNFKDQQHSSKNYRQWQHKLAQLVAF
jgi:hypothetical protein